MTSCRDEGCAGSLEDVPGQEVECEDLFTILTPERIGCEIGRDFRFMSFGPFADDVDRGFQCLADGQAQNFDLPSDPADDPNIERLVNSTQCIACCDDANARFDNGAPDDFSVNDCRVRNFDLASLFVTTTA